MGGLPPDFGLTSALYFFCHQRQGIVILLVYIAGYPISIVKWRPIRGCAVLRQLSAGIFHNRVLIVGHHFHFKTNFRP
jgi:hypothetical protein